MALERQHILTKQEKAVMHLVYSISEKNNGMCLLTPIEIFEQLPLDLEIREEDLWPILRNLEIDDYFDVFIVDENTNGYGASWSSSNMSFTKIVDSSSPTGMALHTERVADGTTGGGTFGLSLIEGEYYRETYIYKAYGN